jgi:hypothetical protein
MRVLIFGYGLDVVTALTEMGADLSIVDNDGANVLHAAAVGGNVECIDHVLAKTTIGIDSIATTGITPLVLSLFKGHYEASIHLVERGVNLFAKLDGGRRAIDVPLLDEPNVFLGPRVLDHFKNIKCQSVKHLLLLYASYAALISTSEAAAQVQPSTYLASRVLASPDLIRVIASYFFPSKIITRDKSIKAPDAVRERVEAELGF